MAEEGCRTWISWGESAWQRCGAPRNPGYKYCGNCRGTCDETVEASSGQTSRCGLPSSTWIMTPATDPGGTRAKNYCAVHEREAGPGEEKGSDRVGEQ
jgi:hypothetical protein